MKPFAANLIAYLLYLILAVLELVAFNTPRDRNLEAWARRVFRRIERW